MSVRRYDENNLNVTRGSTFCATTRPFPSDRSLPAEVRGPAALLVAAHVILMS
jgi:hypothetical protein